MDLRQLLNTLRRRWKLSTAVLLLCLLGALGITSVIAPQYGSTVRVYIAATNAGSGVDASALAYLAAQKMTAYSELAKEPTVLEQVIQDAGVDITTEELAANLTATVAVGSTNLRIDVTAANPGAAQDLARAHAAAMQDLVARLETPEATRNDRAPVPLIEAKVPGDASYSAEPVSPNLPLNLVVGGLIGLVLGVLAAILREMFDTSVRSTAEMSEIAGAPVLAVVPDQPSFSKHPLITDHDAPHGRGEPYRVLRTNLQFVDLDSRRQMFVITSAVPEEGKSVTAVNLAIAMAQSGREVLLIDCDLRKPSVAKLLGLDNAVGLMTAVTGHAPLYDCVQHHSSGVDVLATGPQPPNPAEVIDTEAVRAILKQTQVEYDVVIIDAPPLLAVADPAILASIVGGALMVVRHGRTSRENVRQAVHRLRAVDARIFGVIANVTPRREIESYSYEYYGDVPQFGRVRGLLPGPRQGGGRDGGGKRAK